MNIEQGFLFLSLSLRHFFAIFLRLMSLSENKFPRNPYYNHIAWPLFGHTHTTITHILPSKSPNQWHKTCGSKCLDYIYIYRTHFTLNLCDAVMDGHSIPPPTPQNKKSTHIDAPPRGYRLRFAPT